MTLFTVGFPYECTVRIYDAFLVEGQKILYRVALLILKENEKQILNGGMEDFFAAIKLFINNMDEG
jgi:hypothetical protein